MDVTKVLNYLNIPWSQDTTYVMETSEFLTKATTTPLKEK